MKKLISFFFIILGILTIVSCGTTTPTQTSEITIINIEPNDSISSPLKITGEVKGNWFFENSFPVKLTDMNNNVIAITTASSSEDWMTTNIIPFSATLTFDNPKTSEGFLVFQKDNPSGLPQNDASFSIPIKFKNVAVDQLTVKVFFQNSVKNPNIQDCSLVFPVNRTIAHTQSTARIALEELLKGPTESEKEQGYLTTINDGVIIQKLTIVDGVAKVDFNERLQEKVGGSCWVGTISAQIRETLKQFPAVKTVIISINGNSEDILQP